MRCATRSWVIAGALVAGALALSHGAQAANGTITLVRNDSTVDGYTGDFGGGEFGATQFSGMTFPALGPGVAVGTNPFQTFCVEGNEHLPSGVLTNWTLGTASSAGGNGGGSPDPLSPQTAYLFSQFWNGDLSGYDYAPLGGTIPGVNRRTSANDLQAAIWYLEDEWLGSAVSGPDGQHFGWNYLSPRAQGWVNDAYTQTAPGGTWYALWGANSIGNVRVLVVTNLDGSNAQDVLVLTTDTPPHSDECVIDSSIKSEFNGTAILAGNCIWFNSHFKLKGVGNNLVTVTVTNVNVSSTEFNLDLPDAVVTFNPAATTATTTFNAGLNRWETTVPSSYTSNVFMSGGFLHLPSGLKGGVKNVNWSATFSISTPVPISLSWQWSAAAYKAAACDVEYEDLCVKPVDANNLSQYQNSDHAGTPECVKTLVTGGARGGGGSNFTGSWSGTASFNCD